MSEKIRRQYDCLNCDYHTSDKRDYGKHLKTKKHAQSSETTIVQQILSEISDDHKNHFYCSCCKKYKHNASLFNHKKNCSSQVTTSCDNKIVNKLIETNMNLMQTNNNLVETNNNLLESNNNLVEDNKSMKEIILKCLENNTSLIEKIPQLNNNAINTINTQNNNTQNNTVNNNINNNINIKIFLNDQCKDAMKMSDFISNIEVDVDDLMLTKEKGLTEGISNLIITHLNKLPLIRRPIWCSDKKRKKLYIKEDAWFEDVDKIKTKEAIKYVSKKQTQNITKYTKIKPNWFSSDSDKETYMLIIRNTTDSVDDKSDKIIDNLINTIHFNEDKIK